MDKIKNFFKQIKCPDFCRRHKKLTVAVIAVLIILLIFAFIPKGKKTAINITTTDYVVKKGSVSVTITGSGTLEANEQYDVSSLVSGDVLSDYFEEGDLLNEGDIMYEIDSSNAQRSISKAKNSLENATDTYQNASKDYEAKQVKAPISGVITASNVKAGESISQNGSMYTITDTSKLKLEIKFNEKDAENIFAGNRAEVWLTDNSHELQGTVTRVSTGSILSSYGTKESVVTIEVLNPGSVKAGDKATAIVNGYACSSEGVFSDFDSVNVVPKVQGEVAFVYAGLGDHVTKGQVLAVIDSSSADKSFKSASLSYKDALTSLDDAYDTLEDYTITAPITGTVLSKTIKEGDKISGNNGQTVMAIIADMSKMKFTIYVDELDISKMEKGQKVSVTAEALEGQRFNGYIDKISVVGTTQNSVTTYPVTVVLEEYGDLIPGMNVDAEIIVSETNDVLCVPLSAVQRGNIVYVKNEDLKDSQKSDGKEENNKAAIQEERFKGYTPVKVQTGISNSDMVEIKSGLYEGQKIAVVMNEASNGMENMMKMMGQMGGGMPSGGMPSGGMQGSRMPSGGRQ